MNRNTLNKYDQEIGFAVANFSQGLRPTALSFVGRYCIVEHLADKHESSLYQHLILEGAESDWTYLPYEMPKNKAEFHSFLHQRANDPDAYFFTVIDKQSGDALGIFSLMHINESMRSIEMGCVIYSKQLMRTVLATEAQYLVAKYVFEELEYRRYEWKCDALNKRSHQAALRLGFIYEGTFRQAIVYKGRNRDTAWHSMLDCEWPERKKRFEQYLDVDNFDEKGVQKISLSKLPL